MFYVIYLKFLLCNINSSQLNIEYSIEYFVGQFVYIVYIEAC